MSQHFLCIDHCVCVFWVIDLKPSIIHICTIYVYTYIYIRMEASYNRDTQSSICGGLSIINLPFWVPGPPHIYMDTPHNIYIIYICSYRSTSTSPWHNGCGTTVAPLFLVIFWLFDIAMAHGPLIDDFPFKSSIFSRIS